MSDLAGTMERLKVARDRGWVDITVFPCGCITGIQVDEGGSRDNPDDCGFGMVPCSTGCKYLAYAQDTAARQHKPMEMQWVS